MMNRYAVIMAGGVGSRFWPLSRSRSPKQLLRLMSDRTLLEDTIRRLTPLIPLERVLVVCNRVQAADVASAMPDLPAENIVGEPVGRNTAACLALAASLLHRRDPGSVFCALPADHFIRDDKRFRFLLDIALKAAESLKTLVTFGIVPSSPHTGYGYVRAADLHTTIEGTPILRAEQFVEKPNRHTAEEYLAKGSYYWNSGMFAWATDVLLGELQRHQPEVIEPLSAYFARPGADPSDEAFADVFARLPAISIDYGVMEKSRSVSLIRSDFGWDDMGSWDALDILPHGESGNVILGDRVVAMDSRRCILYGRDLLTVCLGVEDLIVVTTPDAVLVTRKSRAQDVKTVVEKLRESGREEYL